MRQCVSASARGGGGGPVFRLWGGLEGWREGRVCPRARAGASDGGETAALSLLN